MSKPVKIDLHCHTTCSDGLLTPSELIDRAHNMQVDVLAITDHDDISAYNKALIHQKKQKRALELVSGVEISTYWHSFEIHIVGLNFDVQNQTLVEFLQQQAERRLQRAARIGEKLSKCGYPEVLDKALSLANGGQITRSHFARVLVRDYQFKDMQSAFDKLLGKGKGAYVRPQWPTITQAVKVLVEAGGKAVIAHPGHYGLTGKWMRRLITEFKAAGGIGFEVVHAKLSPAVNKQMANYTNEYQLEASAGSDFHGPNRWCELGRRLTLPDDVKPIWHDWAFLSDKNHSQTELNLL